MKTYEFWSRFPMDLWEKQSFVLDEVPHFSWIEDSNCLFKLTTEIVSNERSNPMDLRFIVTQEGRNYEVETGNQVNPDSLPQPKDNSFEQYNERLRKSFAKGVSGYSLVLNNVLKSEPRVWLGVRNFLKGFCEKVGLPSGGVSAGIMIGQYPRTPFGVHMDEGRSALIFPVVGQKKYRFWGEDYVKTHPELNEAVSYEKHEAESTCLIANPGEVVYWPSTAYHIAEEGEKFTAMFSVGVFKSRKPEHPASYAIDPNNLQASAGHLPDYIERLVRSSQAPTAQSLDSATRHWLELVTRLGIKFPIPRRYSPLNGGALKIADREFPIVTAALTGGECCIAANGHSIISNSPECVEIVRRLNSGEEISIENLSKEQEGPVTAMLNALWRFRVIDAI